MPDREKTIADYSALMNGRENEEGWEPVLMPLIMARDALALLREQEAVKPEWISVNDRLPMLIETVLFIGKNYYGNWFGVKRGYFDGSFWHSDDYGTIYSTTPVTHWMPLPEPPKEKA